MAGLRLGIHFAATRINASDSEAVDPMKGLPMLRRMRDSIRRGAVSGKSGIVYILLWLLGVPALWLVLLFAVGVGR